MPLACGLLKAFGGNHAFVRYPRRPTSRAEYNRAWTGGSSPVRYRAPRGRATRLGDGRRYHHAATPAGERAQVFRGRHGLLYQYCAARVGHGRVFSMPATRSARLRTVERYRHEFRVHVAADAGLARRWSTPDVRHVLCDRTRADHARTATVAAALRVHAAGFWHRRAPHRGVIDPDCVFRSRGTAASRGVPGIGIDDRRFGHRGDCRSAGDWSRLGQDRRCTLRHRGRMCGVCSVGRTSSAELGEWRLVEYPAAAAARARFPLGIGAAVCVRLSGLFRRSRRRYDCYLSTVWAAHVRQRVLATTFRRCNGRRRGVHHRGIVRRFSQHDVCTEQRCNSNHRRREPPNWLRRSCHSCPAWAGASREPMGERGASARTWRLGAPPLRTRCGFRPASNHKSAGWATGGGDRRAVTWRRAGIADSAQLAGRTCRRS